MTWPATTAPAMGPRSSSAQPKACMAGPTMTEASVTRPVTTTCAPAASASAMGRAPRYALAETRGAPAGSGSPVSRLRNCSPADWSSGTRSVMSSPETDATVTSTPCRRASSRTASARPVGLRPPALDTMVMLRSMQVGSTSSSWRRKVPAYPPLRWRVLCRMYMVSSASQSPVSTSIGPPSTISRAAETRSPKKPLQLAMRRADGCRSVTPGPPPPAGRPRRPAGPARTTPR
jgi:hypothetical protein